MQFHVRNFHKYTRKSIFIMYDLWYEAKHSHVMKTLWGIHITALFIEQHLVAMVIFCGSFLSRISITRRSQHLKHRIVYCIVYRPTYLIWRISHAKCANCGNINYFKQTVSNNTHKESCTQLGTQNNWIFFFHFSQ